MSLLAVIPVAANRSDAAVSAHGFETFTKQRWLDEHNVAAASQLADASQLVDVSQVADVSQLVSQLADVSQPADVNQPVVVSHLAESKSA